MPRSKIGTTVIYVNDDYNEKRNLTGKDLGPRFGEKIPISLSYELNSITIKMKRTDLSNWREAICRSVLRRIPRNDTYIFRSVFL